MPPIFPSFPSQPTSTNVSIMDMSSFTIDEDDPRILKLKSRLQETENKNKMLRDAMKDMKIKVDQAIEESSKQLSAVHKEKRE
jgi:hypothetical protein